MLVISLIKDQMQRSTRLAMPNPYTIKELGKIDVAKVFAVLDLLKSFSRCSYLLHMHCKIIITSLFRSNSVSETWHHELISAICATKFIQSL